MTLDEAIKQLSDEAESPRYNFDPDRVAAFQLGIEALKAIQWYRDYPQAGIIAKLPGETEE